MSDDWLQYLRLMGQAGGALNGAGAFGGGGGGLTMPPVAEAPIAPPTAMPPIDPSGIAMPGAVPMAAPLPVMPNAGLPSTPGTWRTPSGDPYADVRQGPISVGPSPDPAGYVAQPSPGGPGTVPASGPIGGAPLAPPVPFPDPTKPPPNWFDRNVGDPLSRLWNGTPKLGADGKPIIGPDGKPVMDEGNQLTPRQKALVGGASSIGAGLAARAAAPAAAPAISGGGGAGAYKPAAFDASRLAAGRAAEIAALRQKAALNAPWLKRYQSGLMGG